VVLHAEFRRVLVSNGIRPWHWAYEGSGFHRASSACAASRGIQFQPLRARNTPMGIGVKDGALDGQTTRAASTCVARRF
jgi:hypothetical protein